LWRVGVVLMTAVSPTVSSVTPESSTLVLASIAVTSRLTVTPSGSL